MEEYMMEIIKRTSAFLVLAQAVIHFRPNPSYEKYFKFLVGIMTIVILAVPLMELGSRDIGRQYAACMNLYTEKLEEMTAAMAEDTDLTVTPSGMYLEEMADAVSRELEPYAAEKGYRIEKTEIRDTKTSEEDDGEGIFIRIRMRPADTVVPAVEIEAVRLQEGPAGEETYSDTEKAFRTVFAELLEMEESRLEVRVIE